MSTEATSPDSPQAGRSQFEQSAEADRMRGNEDSGLQVETDIQQLLEKVQTLTDERDQMKDQVLRAMADFQNFKRRNQQEMAQLRQFAIEKFVRDLLPVLDNFERTTSHLNAGASPENIMEGIGAVDRQLRQVLESHSVTRVPSVGVTFDPEIHEALGIEHHEEHPDDTVSTELEPGYKMGDKVIRAAKVRIVKRNA